MLVTVSGDDKVVESHDRWDDLLILNAAMITQGHVH